MKQIATILSIIVPVTAMWGAGCREDGPSGAGEVVVYVSEDQVFSEPILKDFERETGIKVKAVYDTEETKSTGVMMRLISEKNNPLADVFWANEPIRAEVLKQKGIAAAYESPNARDIPDIHNDNAIMDNGDSHNPVRHGVCSFGVGLKYFTIPAYFKLARCVRLA